MVLISWTALFPALVDNGSCSTDLYPEPVPTILEPRHLTACFAHGTASIRIRQQHRGRQPRWVTHTGSLLLPAYQRLDAVDRTSLIGTPS